MNNKEFNGIDIHEIKMLNQFMKKLIAAFQSGNPNDGTQDISYFFPEFSSTEDFNRHLIMSLNMFLNRAFAFSGLFQLLGITEEQLNKAIQDVKNSDYKDNTSIIRLFRG